MEKAISEETALTVNLNPRVKSTTIQALAQENKSYSSRPHCPQSSRNVVVMAPVIIAFCPGHYTSGTLPHMDAEFRDRLSKYRNDLLHHREHRIVSSMVDCIEFLLAEDERICEGVAYE
jgi:hypothetical protein